MLNFSAEFCQKTYLLGSEIILLLGLNLYDFIDKELAFFSVGNFTCSTCRSSCSTIQQLISRSEKRHYLLSVARNRTICIGWCVGNIKFFLWNDPKPYGYLHKSKQAERYYSLAVQHSSASKNWMVSLHPVSPTLWSPALFLCTLNRDRTTESCRSWWDQAALLQQQLTQPCSAGSLTTDSHVPNTSSGSETCSFSQNPVFAAATRGICEVSACSSPLSQTGRKAKVSLPEYWFKIFFVFFSLFVCCILESDNTMCIIYNLVSC